MSDHLRWIVIEKDRDNTRQVIARFQDSFDARLFARVISRSFSNAFFVTAAGDHNDSIWEGGEDVSR